ncbi:atrial natriuretic peptide-converting enzyme-like [Gigantopelta aegis]|uniref:atrial natriuretic peptide-converting enzyme-like n=1 Tax=Gigantopelta aegis TaxID=1735272 RepID=UPI001B88CDFC|nr:atrial natriuretic peptide-converting enzyme-like [Gigantopelta aegis]
MTWWEDTGCGDPIGKGFVCESKARNNTEQLVSPVVHPPTRAQSIDRLFNCRNGELIWESRKCDGHPDCSDGSDEQSCGGACASLQFPCMSNDQCISWDMYCDQINDCVDKSDETMCIPKPCDEDEWRCSNAQCINRLKVCDLTPGCRDGSDELGCSLFLKFLVSMQRAKYVLDIGMFTGYSALSMAEALPADGKVFTCDRELYLADLNRKVFDSSPHGKKIEIRLGDVGDTLKALANDGVQIDFVFLDAGGEKYGEYFDFLLDKNILAPRGTIAVDNTLLFGRSYLEHENHRAKFNKTITEDRRVQQVLLTVRDGITLIRRTDDVYGQV